MQLYSSYLNTQTVNSYNFQVCRVKFLNDFFEFGIAIVWLGQISPEKTSSKLAAFTSGVSLLPPPFFATFSPKWPQPDGRAKTRDPSFGSTMFLWQDVDGGFNQLIKLLYNWRGNCGVVVVFTIKMYIYHVTKTKAKLYRCWLITLLTYMNIK